MSRSLTIAIALSWALTLTAAAGEAEKKPAEEPTKKAAEEPAKKVERPVVLIKTSMGEIRAELFPEAAPETVKNFIGLAEGRKEFTDASTGKKVKRHFYDGLIFHRVIKNFMLQGGCPQGTGRGGPGYSFKDEINATGLGLDKIKAFDEKKGPHKYLMIRDRMGFQRMLLMPLLRSMGIKNQEGFKKRQEEVKKELASLTIKGAYENLGYKYDEKLPAHHPRKGVLAMANSGPNTNGSQFFINLVDTPWLTGKHTVFGKVIKGMEVVEKIGEVEVGPGAAPREKVTITSIRVVERPEAGKKKPAEAKKPAEKA